MLLKHAQAAMMHIWQAALDGSCCPHPHLLPTKASMSPSASSGSSSADGGSCEWCEEHIPQISAAQCRCSTTMHNVAASLPFLKCYGLIIRSWNVAKQSDASWTGGKSKVLDPYLILRSKIIQRSLEAKLPTIWQRREEEKKIKEEKESEERSCKCAKR